MTPYSVLADPKTLIQDYIKFFKDNQTALQADEDTLKALGAAIKASPLAGELGKAARLRTDKDLGALVINNTPLHLEENEQTLRLFTNNEKEYEEILKLLKGDPKSGLIDFYKLLTGELPKQGPLEKTTEPEESKEKTPQIVESSVGTPSEGQIVISKKMLLQKKR